MFNGIIKNTGRIKKIIRSGNNCTLSVISNLKFTKNEIGSSISCSGVCLSLERFRGSISQFYLSKETIMRSNFKFLKKGNTINLEKSLSYGERISGHFVQGHVDTTAKIKLIKRMGKSWSIFFKLSKKYKKYLAQKGSIAINGISLTISKILEDGFSIIVIPQTIKFTNLIYIKKNDFVNVEFDLFAKYIKNSRK